MEKNYKMVKTRYKELKEKNGSSNKTLDKKEKAIEKPAERKAVEKRPKTERVPSSESSKPRTNVSFLFFFPGEGISVT